MKGQGWRYKKRTWAMATEFGGGPGLHEPVEDLDGVNAVARATELEARASALQSEIDRLKHDNWQLGTLVERVRRALIRGDFDAAVDSIAILTNADSPTHEEVLIDDNAELDAIRRRFSNLGLLDAPEQPEAEPTLKPTVWARNEGMKE